VAIAGAVAWGPAHAIDDRADLVPNETPEAGRDWAWRATLGRYHQNVDPSGLDANLARERRGRHRLGRGLPRRHRRAPGPRGLGEAGALRAGAAARLAAAWFVRAAYDPHVSYGESDMVRRSVGLRF
jgi:hypothetical protein